MQKALTLCPIGAIRSDAAQTQLVLDRQYADALTGLEGFSHVQILWWFSQNDPQADASPWVEASPYRNGPTRLGTFATRSPMRPNPIALSCAQVLAIDKERATLTLAWLDALGGSPVLDIKPYTPSLDRVEAPAVPAWCAHWPNSIEASGDFDWSTVFTF